MPESSRSRLARAHAATSALVHAVPGDCWSVPTPCPDWDVTALVQHLWSGETLIATLVRGERPDRPAVYAAAAAIGPADLATAYDEVAAATRAAFDAPGAMDRAYELPIGVLPAELMVELRAIETLTHGWDLTRAVGRPLVVDDVLVEEAITQSRVLLERVPAGRTPFGTPQPVDDDAPALDRLAALLGRTV